MRRLYRIQGQTNGRWETWNYAYREKDAWQLAYEYALSTGRQRIRLVTTNNIVLWERMS